MPSDRSAQKRVASDAGSGGPPLVAADISQEAVARAAGASVAELAYFRIAASLAA